MAYNPYGRGGGPSRGPPMRGGMGMGPRPGWPGPEQNYRPRMPPQIDPRDRSRSPLRDDYRGPLDPYSHGTNPPPPPSTSSAGKVPNDCEIIVHDGEFLTEYAEQIERSIREMGLRVDLMYPRDDVDLNPFLETISNEGTSFALMIDRQNESHQSCTVIVLKKGGKRTQHKNMPLPAAYALIKERFQKVATLAAPRSNLIPPAIKSILQILVENRPLSESEYKLLIDYLRERRRSQMQTEGRLEAFEEESIRELQSKVMGIIGGGGAEPQQQQPMATVDPTQLAAQPQQFAQFQNFGQSGQGVQQGRVGVVTPSTAFFGGR